MSEINSISNGSFVLGNTSATTFSGGTGIRITQPEAGVVSIANDETILYESSSGIASSGSTAQLNEPLTNFNFVDFYIKGPYNPSPQINRYFVDNANSYRGASFVIDASQKHDWRYTFTADNTNKVLYLTRSIIFHQGYNSTTITYNTPDVTGSIPCSMVKVVGINRKENA